MYCESRKLFSKLELICKFLLEPKEHYNLQFCDNFPRTACLYFSCEDTDINVLKEAVKNLGEIRSI